jgi:hypothetical protein
MLTTLSLAGLEELFVACGVPVTSDQPPAEEVLSPPEELIGSSPGTGARSSARRRAKEREPPRQLAGAKTRLRLQTVERVPKPVLSCI